MGEVLLDSENLFFGFGWTPGAQHQHERREFLQQFASHPRLKKVWDRLAVESLGRSSVHAVADWSRGHLAAKDAVVRKALSYGKLDRGVETVLIALGVEGFVHRLVPHGKNIAEQRILERLDAHGWQRGPYVIGSSDKSVPSRICAMLAKDPQLHAVLVMRPDVYEREKDAWFLSTAPEANPLFPLLGEYGVGHVALHKITDDYLTAQRAAGTRRADPVPPSVLPPNAVNSAEPTPEQLWDLWSTTPTPKPTWERPLSTREWVVACRNRGIPAAVFRPLRDTVVELYGDAFETGDGPVSWGLAVRAAASVPLVRAHPVEAPSRLSDTRSSAYHEAWTRLMSRPRGDSPPN